MPAPFVVIFLSFAGMMPDVDALPFSGDVEAAGDVIWLLMALWALGVALLTVWPLAATLVFATVAVLALLTMVRSDAQAETYGGIMML